MAKPKKKSDLPQILQLVNQLSPDELLELKVQLDIKAPSPTWSNNELKDSPAREAFFKQEEAKAGKRVRQAFEHLQSQGILDAKGDLMKSGLPDDMMPGSECDVGG